MIITRDMIEELITAAISVLHHDLSEGGEVESFERGALRKQFSRILKIEAPGAGLTSCKDCGGAFTHVPNSGDGGRCEPCRRQHG